MKITHIQIINFAVETNENKMGLWTTRSSKKSP